jgi:hypothetical protein
LLYLQHDGSLKLAGLARDYRVGRAFQSGSNLSGRINHHKDGAHMPVYDYFCESNGRTIEVRHRVDVELGTWGEVCYAAHLPLGDTDFLAPVRKRLSPAALAFPVSDSTLRNQGFTKLVKRDQGVYENLTRSGDEARYMRADDPDSVPDLKRKISD